MTQRDRIMLVVVGVVAVTVAFWFFALGPKRREAARLGQEVSAQQQKLDEARQQVSAGMASQDRFPANYAAVAQLGKAVPADDDVPSLVLQLEGAARRTGVDFRELELKKGSGSAPTPPAPPASGSSGSAPGSPPEGGQSPPSQQAGPTSGAPAPAPAPGGGASPGPATATGSATLPPGTAIGPAGFPSLPLAMTFTGGFFQLADFLRKVDRFVVPRGPALDVNGRLLSVDGVSLAPKDDGSMEASVAITGFLVPEDQGLTGGATPQGPAGAAPPPAPGASSGTPPQGAGQATTQ